jgi:hypothetical protein
MKGRGNSLQLRGYGKPGPREAEIIDTRDEYGATDLSHSRIAIGVGSTAKPILKVR